MIEIYKQQCYELLRNSSNPHGDIYISIYDNVVYAYTPYGTITHILIHNNEKAIECLGHDKISCDDPSIFHKIAVYHEDKVSQYLTFKRRMHRYRLFKLSVLIIAIATLMYYVS